MRSEDDLLPLKGLQSATFIRDLLSRKENRRVCPGEGGGVGVLLHSTCIAMLRCQHLQ